MSIVGTCSTMVTPSSNHNGQHMVRVALHRCAHSVPITVAMVVPIPPSVAGARGALSTPEKAPGASAADSGWES